MSHKKIDKDVFPGTGSAGFVSYKEKAQNGREELLELIDFQKKRDYSLQQLNAEKASEETEAERVQGEMTEEESASEIQTAQEQTADQPAWNGAGEGMTAYEGQMGIQCMAAGADGLYLGGRGRKHENPDRRRGDLGKRSGADPILLCGAALKTEIILLGLICPFSLKKIFRNVDNKL